MNNDNGSEYKYSGSQKPTDACVLVYNPGTQQMTLDKLDTQFEFNLQSTPTNKDAPSLAQKYAHIGTEQPDSSLDVTGEVAGSADPEGDDTADPNNPYDYRHFLHEATNRRTPSSSPRPRAGSSPAHRPSAISSPATRPIRPAARPKPRPRPQQKRAAASPPPREEADADNEDSDGDLVIEMEPDTKRRNRFMGAFDRDIVSNGPISLRSAASSMSPAARAARRDDSFERHGDADVEELKLPSPRRSPPVKTPQQEAEDEADFEAALEQALEESQADEGEGGGGVGIADRTTGGRHEESSSESEEE